MLRKSQELNKQKSLAFNKSNVHLYKNKSLPNSNKFLIKFEVEIKRSINLYKVHMFMNIAGLIFNKIVCAP